MFDDRAWFLELLRPTVRMSCKNNSASASPKDQGLETPEDEDEADEDPDELHVEELELLKPCCCCCCG